MLFDVNAEVISNTRLSSDYNVLALAAPEIARALAPGQFVMVKPTHGLEPLLRRPFSVFEILRDGPDRPVGVSLLNKRVGVGTNLLFDAEVGARVGCVGPLGRPFVPVDPPEEAWMVAGGVGLAPFASLAEALVERGTPMTLFYGARSSADLFYDTFFERLGARMVLTTEDGTRGEAGRVTAPLERALSGAVSRSTDHDLRVRSDADDARGRPAWRPLRPPRVRVARAGHGLRHGRLLQLRRPRPARRRNAFRAIVSGRPGLRCLGRRLGRPAAPWLICRSGSGRCT